MEQQTLGKFLIMWFSEGKGCISCREKGTFFDFFIGHNFSLSFFSNGKQVCPAVPKYVKKKIVAVETLRRERIQHA